MTQDFTERRAIEQALSQGEQHFRAVFDRSPISIIEVDCTGRYVRVNPAWAAMLGYEQDELAGKNVRDVTHAEDLEHTEACIAAVLFQGQGITHMEKRFLHKDGSIVWGELSANAREDAHGETTLLAMVINITARKEVQRALTELSRWHEQMLNSAGEGIIGLDAEGRVVFINPAATRMLGYASADALIGMASHALWCYAHADGAPYPKAVCPIDASLRDVEIRHIDNEVFWRSDGTHFPVAFTSTPMFDGDRLTGTVLVFQDITERRRAEAVLRDSQARLQAIIKNEPECVKLIDSEGRVLEINPAGLAMLEADAPAQVIGHSICGFVLPEYLPAQQELCKRVFSGQSGVVEFEAKGLKGRRLWLETHAVPLRDESGGITALLAVTRDITERRQAEERLEHDALYDALTGLPNRMLFMNRLGYCLEHTKRRPGYMFAVLFLDLDRFKMVNDSLGHIAGDALLIDIAHRLELCVRAVDTVARLGGDEFSLLLDDIADLADATRIVERIQHALSEPFQHQGQEVFSSASIGIALSTPGYERPEDIMRDADTAMYRAKQSGRARFQLFDAAMHERALQTLRLETDLRYAVEREELMLYYQPIMDAMTNRLKGFEALLRWQHPERGLISPAEFIPIAEETGLIVPIGAWVLRTACRQMRRWHLQFSQHDDLPVSVNLSGRQFLSAGLAATVRNALSDAELEGRHLQLEITESVLIESPKLAAEVLLQFKALGVTLCMDDFGTGYSSLSTLHGLPIDILKIDKSFVSRMELSTKNMELVRTIVGLARNLGMGVVAEGVETQDQLDRLRSLQCDYAQGYLFSKPLPADRVPDLLERAGP